MKKSIMLVLILTTIFSYGCKERVFPNTNCYVFAVHNNLNTNWRVCCEKDVYYYYSNGGIYQYKDKESVLVIDNLESQVTSMICKDEKIYYDTETGNGLHIYDMKTGEQKEIQWEEKWPSILVLDEDLFELAEKDTDYMLYAIENDEKKLISQFARAGKEGETFEIEYKDYVFYFETKREQWRLGNIRNSSGKQYTYTGTWINGKYLSVVDEEYTYDGKFYDMGDIIEKERGGSATSPLHSNMFNGKVYMLYQYGLRAAGSKVNPVATDKAYNDCIYSLEPETGEVELVYKTNDPTIQIAGFSVEDDVLFLLKNDGLYRCNMKGEQEEFILENHYETMSFEHCNGKLFVFEDDYSFDSEFIGVVE